MQELIGILFKWLKPIIGVCIIAAIASAAIALMLPEKIYINGYLPNRQPSLDGPRCFV